MDICLSLCSRINAFYQIIRLGGQDMSSKARLLSVTLQTNPSAGGYEGAHAPSKADDTRKGQSHHAAAPIGAVITRVRRAPRTGAATRGDLQTSCVKNHCPELSLSSPVFAGRIRAPKRIHALQAPCCLRTNKTIVAAVSTREHGSHRWPHSVYFVAMAYRSRPATFPTVAHIKRRGIKCSGQCAIAFSIDTLAVRKCCSNK